MGYRSRIASLLFLALIFGNVAEAQYRWNGKEKHWYKDWLWWVGEATIGAILAADAHSTTHARSACPGCIESNPFIGQKPDKGETIGLAAVGFGILTALQIGSWEECPDPDRASRAWHVACDLTIPSIGAFITGPKIVHNYGLSSGLNSAQPSASGPTRHARLSTLHYTRPDTSLDWSSMGDRSPAWNPTWGSSQKGVWHEQLFIYGRGASCCPAHPPDWAAEGTRRDLRSVHFR